MVYFVNVLKVADDIDHLLEKLLIKEVYPFLFHIRTSYTILIKQIKVGLEIFLIQL